MAGLVPVTVQCPHCWEPIEVLIDTSVAEQEYVEDCQVCCQPLLFTVEAAVGAPLEGRATRQRGNSPRAIRSIRA